MFIIIKLMLNYFKNFKTNKRAGTNRYLLFVTLILEPIKDTVRNALFSNDFSALCDTKYKGGGFKHT